MTRVVYRKHKTRAGKLSLKVTYYCGLRMFSQWVCLEHDKFALRKAHLWWEERSREERVNDVFYPPTTVDEALGKVEQLRTPINIDVWINKKYPEVMSYEFARD